MWESAGETAQAGRSTTRGSTFRRLNRALAEMNLFSATALLTGFAILLAEALHILIESFFYSVVQPATLISAAVVTMLVAMPIIAYSQLLIRQAISSRMRLKRATDHLRRREQHLKHAQGVSMTGSSERDLVTGAVEWSDEMYRLAGVDRARFELADDNMLGLVVDEDRELLKTIVLASRRGVRQPPAEFRIRRPDGQVRTVYCETDVISDDSGKPVRALTVFKDVSELRAAQQRQKEMEQQLLHVQKLEALGTLAGGVAHELNNTLVPVLSLAKLTMKRLPEGSREQKNVMTILQAGTKARDLVQRILAFSRKEMPTRVGLDIADVTRQALALLRHSLPSTIRFDERIEPVPLLAGDPGQISQIVINLVVNAVQATPHQNGTIIVEVAPAPGERLPQTPDRIPGPAVRLSVIDQGVGMDKSTIARIFDPFFTTKRPGEGTGLGLSVVHGIVKQHAGHVAVESEPGKGTRFDVYLPAVSNEELAKIAVPEHAA
jgi:PAS domain S-box-containing protein